MSLMFKNQLSSSGSTETILFGSEVSQAYVVLAGFNVAYAPGDSYELLNLTVSIADPTMSGNSVSYLSTVTMKDSTGNQTSGDLYALGIGATADDGTVFIPWPSWVPGPGGPPVTITLSNMPSALNQAWVFITSFVASYGSNDKNVSRLNIASGQETLQTASVQQGENNFQWTITFQPALVMQDASGNVMDNSASSMALLVVASPAELAGEETATKKAPRRAPW